jgi:hypothetical protein
MDLRVAMIDRRLWVLLASAALCMAACAMDADETPSEEQSVATLEQALTPVLSVDFESYALGPLGAPWSVVKNTMGGASRADIASAAGHGKVLWLRGLQRPKYEGGM